MSPKRRRAAVRLGDELRAWRLLAGLTQEGAARAVGVRQWTISRLEAGEVEARFELVTRLFSLYRERRKGCRGNGRG